MAKNTGFVNPTVRKSIETAAGTAYYQQTEIEDLLGRWNDNYYREDGYYVIHEGNQHHVYKVQTKGKVSAGVRSPHIAGGKYQFQGKGWHGDEKGHRDAAMKGQAREANNTPMTERQRQVYELGKAPPHHQLAHQLLAKRQAKQAQNEPVKKAHEPPYRVDVWEERDRLIITVYDRDDKEVASWVDDEARQMFEDGFFDSRNLEQSVLGYLRDLKELRIS